MKVKTDIATMKLQHPHRDQPVFEEKLDIISIQKDSLWITHLITTNWKEGRPCDIKTKGRVSQSFFFDNFWMATVINLLFDWMTLNILFLLDVLTISLFRRSIYFNIVCIYFNWMNGSCKFDHTIGSTWSTGSDIENSQPVDRTMLPLYLENNWLMLHIVYIELYGNIIWLC